MASIQDRIKEYWSRYTAWQRDPLCDQWVSTTESRETHHCANCYSEFDSEHCPNCGQKHDVGRITWASIWQGVMDLWGLGTRSLPYTLWQLIWRPGYLIADYIRGRRQLSFPPIKMLVFVALFLYILANWLEPTSADTGVHETRNMEFNTFLDFIDLQFSKHYDLTMLTVSSFFILPTYFIFRHSPRVPRHTLPEGFFIQVFNAVIILTITLIFFIGFYLLNHIFGSSIVNENTIGTVFLIFVPIILYRAYLQLFGYGYWGTLWRVLLMLSASILLMLIAYIITYFVFLAKAGEWSYLLNRFLLRFLPFVAGVIGILAFAHFINLRRYNQTDEQGEDNSDASDGLSRPDGAIRESH